MAYLWGQLIPMDGNKKSSKGLLQTLELYYRVKVLSTL